MSKILLADDHAATRRLLAERLVLDGHEVIAIGDAENAYERFSTTRPDMVIASVALPDGGSLAPGLEREDERYHAHRSRRIGHPCDSSRIRSPGWSVVHRPGGGADPVAASQGENRRQLVSGYPRTVDRGRIVARAHVLAALRRNPSSEVGKALLQRINRA